MIKTDPVILGINHMFLYPESMVDGNAHTKTLEKLAENPLMDALDCWVLASHAKQEIKILRDCGKQINYNIGDRLGETPAFPATADKRERAYAMDILNREVDFALECGAKKIIFASGVGGSENAEDAKARYVDFVLEWTQRIPKDVCLTMEPIDYDVDKCFLLGRLEECCACVRKWQENGLNLGILLDMGHIPLLHETLQSAVEKTAPLLRHIHLGNCILKNPENPLYGDKHPGWGAVDGEYDESHGVEYIRQLYRAGYFHRGAPQTVSFEMRPLPGMDAEETLVYLNNWYQNTRSVLKEDV